MKKVFLFATMLAIAASCTVRDNEICNVKAPSMYGCTETDSATKTGITVDAEGVGTIWWKPADQINVFFGSTSVKYYSTNTEDATTVVFETSAMIGSTESASNSKWGLYPYDATATCNGSSVTTTISAVQECVPATFGNNLFPMVAQTATNELHFLNVCGGIKFSLSRDDIQTITFKGNDNEGIAGKVSLSMDENDIPVAVITEGEETITLTPKDGDTFAKNTNYYIVMLPTILTNGFTMTFETETAIGSFEYTTKSIEIKRSVFSKKENIDSYATFETKMVVPEGAVDLGLSVMWATCNIGASSPEESGGYYQWAGLKDVTSTSIDLYWDNCPYHTVSYEKNSGWTKYIPYGNSSYWSGSGSPDNKSVLDLEDDIAHVKLGGKWRMPTKLEFDELINNCQREWVTYKGVNGLKFTSKKLGYTDKWIFLPATGYRNNDRLYNYGIDAYYWSSSLDTSIPAHACPLYFTSATAKCTGNSSSRCLGHSVRPVSE